jgi:hypothetical protein
VVPHFYECLFPLSSVGRTVTNSNGEASVALDYFQSIGATHVGVLFVTVSNANRLYLDTHEAQTILYLIASFYCLKTGCLRISLAKGIPGCR